MCKRLFGLLLSLISIISIICGSVWQCSAAAAELPAVSAKACIVMEATTREVFFSQNADEPLPMASTTKIMTTLLCLESGDLDTPFPVDNNAIQVEGSSMGLVKDDIVTKRALCYGMLLPSGNDAAGATAVKLAGSLSAFADLMNERAAQLGMQNTHFVTPSGLHDEQHYSTAYDMAILTATALQNPDFREICGQATAKVTFGNPPYDRWLKNSNKLLTQCEGVIGVKTGFTDEAGRCLVSACQRDDMTLICVTLNDPNDWQTHTQLYDTLFPQLHKQTVALPETISIPVVGGTADTVLLQATDSITYGTLQDAVDLPLTVHTKPFLFAPVPANQYGGFLVAERDGQSLFQLPLTTQTAVPEQPATPEKHPQKSIWQRLQRWLQVRFS